MEGRTSTEISALEVINVSGCSTPPTPGCSTPPTPGCSTPTTPGCSTPTTLGGSTPPTPGGLDIPPDVLANVRYIFEGFRYSETALRETAALYIKYTAKWEELASRTDELGTIVITDAEYAQKAREGRRKDVIGFPSEYSFDNDTQEKRTCIWRQGSGLWLSEKSSGIMWVGVHGADSICVVTKKGDLDRGRLLCECFKLMPEEEVLALFRKHIICQIEDLVDPAPELRHNLEESIKKPSGVDHGLSTALRQSLQESIKKPFGIVSAKPGINNICNESGNEASSAVCYEEKAIEFLTEKMNRHTVFNLDEIIKTAVCAFQCLFPKKLKATEIEVSVMDPKYRIDDPKYGVPKDEFEFADRTLWEVPTEVYAKHLDAVDEFGPGEIEEPPLIISPKS